VLPVLPVVLSGSVAGGRWRPMGIISGFLLSFTTLTLALTFFVRAFGVDPDILRYMAAGIIIVMAAILLIPALKTRFMALVGSTLGRSQTTGFQKPRQGYWPGLVTGLSLGVVWTPCVGPIMASVITLAISQSVDLGAVAITSSYALGTALPLFAVMQGGRALINRFPGLLGRLGTIQRVFGVLMLATGIALLTGWDRGFQTWLLTTFPGYGSGLTAIEDNQRVRQALSQRSKIKGSGATEGASAIPDRSGTDPLSRTAGQWFNSPPLSLEGLVGKVVLVDFWTYSCINCLRTMPYLKAWRDKYAAKGLVIVGVHTPEFAFEQDATNVAAAIASIGITWPVVQDNGFGIWNAFSNKYWPAHYLFDREGRLVDTHFGEGAYAETEKMIQVLLGDGSAAIASEDIVADTAGAGINPETYLGSARGRATVASGTPDRFGWTLSGAWSREDQYIQSEGDATLSLDFNAREVFLVISPVKGAAGDLMIRVDGQVVETEDVRDGRLSVDGSRLYKVFAAPKTRRGVLTLEVSGSLRLYAFTFS